MKKLIVVILMVSSLRAQSDTVDPVADLNQVAHLPSGAIVYRWETDVNKDGRMEVSLDLKTNYNRQAKHGNPRIIPAWYVYLQNESKTGYALSRGTEDTEVGLGVGDELPLIDPEEMYIGPISQLRQRGIVTIQRDFPINMPPVAYIRAYTIEGDHLKLFLLSKYDFTKGPNSIYDQYLSNSKRTKVLLQEITP